MNVIDYHDEVKITNDDIIDHYNRFMEYIDKHGCDGVRVRCEIELHSLGMTVKEPIFLWNRSIKYYRVPRVLDVIEDMQLSSKHQIIVENHVITKFPIQILNSYKTYVKTRNYHYDTLPVTCTCVLYKPELLPYLWSEYQRWYYGLYDFDITRKNIEFDLDGPLDLRFFESFTDGIMDIRMLKSRYNTLVLRVASEERNPLLKELLFYKFPFEILELCHDYYPVRVHMTLLIK